MSATAETERREDHVEIAHNGEDKPFGVTCDEKVGALLKKALEVFGVVHSPHLFGLFTVGMVELPDGETLWQAHVHPGEKLILRQSDVRGG